MYSEVELEGIRRRSNFYNRKEVTRFILASGVPRSKQAMLKLSALEDTEGSNKAIMESYDCLRNVVFAVHPQQINVRDKTNGKIIVSITR